MCRCELKYLCSRYFQFEVFPIRGSSNSAFVCIEGGSYKQGLVLYKKALDYIEIIQ